MARIGTSSSLDLSTVEARLKDILDSSDRGNGASARNAESLASSLRSLRNAEERKDPFEGVHSVPPENMIFERVLNGTSSNMVVDGSATPVVFKYSPPGGQMAIIARVLIDIIDTAMQADKFGGLTALTNGLKFQVLDRSDNEVLDFLNGGTIKKNHEFSHLAGSDSLVEPAAGEDELLVRWTLSRVGAAMRLRPDQSFAITVQDALAGITHFDATVQGYLIDF